MKSLTREGELDRLEHRLVKLFLPENSAARFSSGDLPHASLRPIADAVRELSSAYTDGSRDDRVPIRASDEAAAYALYFLPLNYMKLRAILALVRPQIAARSVPNAPITVLDFGCGPGTGALAALDTFDAPLHGTGIEPSEAMRSAATRIFDELRSEGIPVAMELLRDDSSLGDSKFDLIIAANVLNELPTDALHPLLDRLQARLSSSGTMVILEPALPSATRRLMSARDYLFATYSELVPLFPCTRRDGCPMLAANDRDWCHGTFEPPRSRLVHQIDELTGFNKHRIKYSALVLRRGGEIRTGLRIVAEVERSKRGTHALACGEGFYGELRTPRPARSDSNRILEKCAVYDRVKVDEIDPLGILGRESSVEVLENAPCLTAPVGE